MSARTEEGRGSGVFIRSGVAVNPHSHNTNCVNGRRELVHAPTGACDQYSTHRELYSNRDDRRSTRHTAAWWDAQWALAMPHSFMTKQDVIDGIGVDGSCTVGDGVCAMRVKRSLNLQSQGDAHGAYGREWPPSRSRLLYNEVLSPCMSRSSQL
jgi:hypothetical protein